MIGQTISHYKILEKLGEGGMGVVYKAHDTELDRLVALKFLPHYLTSDATEKERFYHEARAASALNHANITTIYEIKEFENQLYLAMEFVEGKTLKKLVEQEPPSMKRVLDIAIQVCEGLAAAHEKGIVHRDIKSDNIMLTPKGQVKIMDFGLAKVKGATKLTKAGSTLGTAAYMSPEQAQGEEVDHRSDIFSFGVVLYELLTGKLPFRGEHQAALLYSLVNEDPIPIARFNDKASPDLERHIAKALAKDRDERYQHMDDLLADLRRERKNLEYARTGYVRTSTVTRTDTVTVQPRRRVYRYIIPAAVAVVAVVVLVILNPFNFEVTQQKVAAAEQSSLAVMYFENIPDPEDKDHIGDMLANLLITSLSQVQGMDVISKERLLDIQKDLKVESKSITPEMATKVAQRAGVATMLLGSILQKDPEIAVTARLVDVKSGKILSSQRVTGYSLKRIFALVDTLALLVRKGLNVTPAASEDARSVSEVTTSSPEAYRSYVEGVELNDKFYYAEARAAFKRAIELDGNFAMAYFGLATVRGDITDAERRDAIRRAWELRKNVTEQEQLRIQAAYETQIENNVVKAAQTLEQLLQKYPHEHAVYDFLSVRYADMGEFEKARQTLLKGLQSDSLDKTLWNLLAYTSAAYGNKREAVASLDRYQNLAPAEPNPYDSKGDIYMLFGDVDSAMYWWRKAVSFRADFSSTEKLGLQLSVRQDYPSAEKYFEQSARSKGEFQKAYLEEISTVTAMYLGHLKQARKRFLEFLPSRQTPKLHNWLTADYEILVWQSYELGDYSAMLQYAQELSSELKKKPNNRFYGRGTVAIAYVKNGNNAAASKLLNDLAHDANSALANDRATVAYVEAFVRFEEGKHAEALEQFQEAFRSLSLVHFPQYFYALCLLKAGRVAEAVAEFQRLAVVSPIGNGFFDLTFLPGAYYWPISAVKAHYWLGIAYEQQGWGSRAVNEYEKFLELWKDADFKSVEIQDARARLAKLRGMSVK